VQTFRADKVKFGAAPFEGRQTVQLQGQWRDERQDVLAGSLYVPIDQPKARLVMTLLEPQAPDSLAMWGEFSAVFERKEYMEHYVAEEVARQMMAADPELAASFRKKLESDPEFAANHAARLEFFSSRHPSWDERFNLYPVLRTEQKPTTGL
jgi:hypothetical protein